MKWKIVFTKQAKKDAKKIKSGGLKNEVETLLQLLSKNPLQNPPHFELLKGDLEGVISRRVNYQHRLVYQIYRKEKAIKIIRMWTHYE